MSRRWHHWRPKWRRKKYPSVWQPSGVEHLNPTIEKLKQQLEHTPDHGRAALLEKLLVLQAPRAALAQAQMDAHPHGYHDREKRLYELIDFNDTFVSTVLAEPQEALASFSDRIWRIMTNFCVAQKTPMFLRDQYDAIVRGLAREIAVYLGARREGFDVEMTSRTEDAFGIDMVIRDPVSGKHINIDVKTPSAFRYRLEDLVKEKRITDEQLLQADIDDFITVVNHRDKENVPVTILCVRPEDVGDIVNFQFQNTKQLGTLLRHIVAVSGQR